MGSEWHQVSLADAVEVVSGGTPKTTDVKYWNGTIPWLSVADFNKGYRWVSAAEKHITEKGLSESATTMLHRGDIIISARGTVGALAQLSKPMAFNQSCYGLRGKPGIAENDYLFYLLHQAVSEMKQVAHGGVFDTITRDTFKILQVALPPLPEQRAIAHILGTLDDKIELNRRMSETLEAMTRALFKSWFVDFDPVRAKMEGRWRKGESLPGLPAELWEVFPDRLVDSELGEIPEGWEVKKLAHIAENPRRTVRPGEIDSDVPYIALEHMPKRCIVLADWGTGDGVESNKFEFKRGEVLFGKLRPYFHKVGVAPVDGVCSTDIVVVVPRARSWFAFVLGHLSSSEFVDYTNAGSTGTKMPRTSWEQMAHYELPLPLESVAAAFTKLIQPSVDRILAGIHESRSLSSLRDTLLPKLISGEIRVKDADKFVERAV